MHPYINFVDAFIAAKANNKSKWKDLNLCGVYVQSPLTWAIAAAGKGIDVITKEPGSNDYIWGISRLGSGSHTMALYTTATKDKNNEVSFKIANNFTQLRSGIDSYIQHLYYLFRC